ncbi:hypothetical protein [Paenibacillus sp. ATY16]|uniref:hypothetical protein n=1 Tax=Paenibacillus sp. ATY16 TaxID=1759312 RepID=UPI000E2F0275|nr:hypothetical protein [Paenibacillus sp. ATY16]MCK9857604.1 hypothetical protein [Paenibacillus sp. ATY16]
MVLNPSVKVLSLYKEARLDLWVGNKDNSIQNLKNCKELLTKENYISFKDLDIEEMIDAWRYINTNDLAEVIQISTGTLFSFNLLSSGINTAEFRGRFYGDPQKVVETLENIKFRISPRNSERNTSWSSVSADNDFTASYTLNYQNAVVLGQITFHFNYFQNNLVNNLAKHTLNIAVCKHFLSHLDIIE